LKLESVRILGKNSHCAEACNASKRHVEIESIGL